MLKKQKHKQKQKQKDKDKRTVRNADGRSLF